MSRSSVGPLVFLDTVLEIETANQNTYGIYGQITDHYSARNLLLALQTASRDRCEKVVALRSRDDLDACFDAVRLRALSQPGTEAQQSFDAGMRYIDFLRLICRRESALEQLYSALASAAGSPDLAALFSSLSHACRRQASLAQARYDVETLK